ncbi:MAG: hypothetical protein AAFR31_03220 [Cyanobacteria bacterium J06627_8]
MDALFSLNRWFAYFEKNAACEPDIPWEAHELLTADDYQTIQHSIATFQRGEYSEGRQLMAFARHYAQSQGDNTLAKITQLFVKEEQLHASLLKRFMEKHGIPCLKKEWTDVLFRTLRRHAGYEVSITVLITAEIIALTYYDALQNCTESKVLQAICTRLLSDERAHVAYESELINHMRSQKSAFRQWGDRHLHRHLFLFTTLLVYVEHRLVLNRGGYTFLQFWKACWSDFSQHFDTFQSCDVALER